MTTHENTPAKPQKTIERFDASFFRGCVTGGCLTILGLFVLAMTVPALMESGKKAPNRAACANSLKQVGYAIKMYANEDPDRLFPPISRHVGKLMFDEVMYREFVPDAGILLCPSDDDREHLLEKGTSNIEWRSERVQRMLKDDQSYFYLGYAVANEEDIELFAREYRKHLSQGTSMPLELKGEPQEGAAEGVRTLHRLRDNIADVLLSQEDIENARSLADDDESSAVQRARANLEQRIPLVIERLGNHTVQTDGANVLYLDGHVEFVPRGQWPMTEKTVALLNELDALGAQN